MPDRVIIIGGGEHARVVAEAVRAAGTAELLGFVDPAPSTATVDRLALARLGDDEALARHPDALGVLGLAAVGSHHVRRRIVERLSPRLAGWATVVHPTAWVSPTAVIEPGAVIMAGAIVQSGARLGPHCVVNSGAIVEHDVEIAGFVHVAPRAALGGGARIGADTYIGLGASVRDHVVIGDDVVIGMGAVVVADVAAGRKVMGVPAR